MPALGAVEVAAGLLASTIAIAVVEGGGAMVAAGLPAVTAPFDVASGVEAAVGGGTAVAVGLTAPLEPASAVGAGGLLACSAAAIAAKLGGGGPRGERSCKRGGRGAKNENKKAILRRAHSLKVFLCTL